MGLFKEKFPNGGHSYRYEVFMVEAVTQHSLRWFGYLARIGEGEVTRKRYKSGVGVEGERTSTCRMRG